jgi:hypothetical protein
MHKLQGQPVRSRHFVLQCIQCTVGFRIPRQNQRANSRGSRRSQRRPQCRRSAGTLHIRPRRGDCRRCAGRRRRRNCTQRGGCRCLRRTRNWILGWRSSYGSIGWIHCGYMGWRQRRRSSRYGNWPRGWCNCERKGSRTRQGLNSRTTGWRSCRHQTNCCRWSCGRCRHGCSR